MTEDQRALRDTLLAQIAMAIGTAEQMPETDEKRAAEGHLRWAREAVEWMEP